jgi:hypothetical protein
VFDFLLSGEPARTCKTVWRNDTQIWVLFIQRNSTSGKQMPDDRPSALILYTFAAVAGLSFLAAVYFPYAVAAAGRQATYVPHKYHSVMLTDY